MRCNWVIDRAAGNGHLSSDLECVGLKHNGYLRTGFILCRDFSNTSSEEKAVHSSVMPLLLFHYVAINESL